MIRKRTDGTEWFIPGIMHEWLNKEFLNRFGATELLSVLAGCADMVKTMRTQEEDLLFDFSEERVNFVARMQDFKTAGNFAVDILEERISDRATKLEEADKPGIEVQAIRGDFVPPAFPTLWASRQWLQDQDQETLLEILTTAELVTGQLDIALANVPTTATEEVFKKIRDARNDYRSAMLLARTEVNRRNEINKLDPDEMFAVKVNSKWLNIEHVYDMKNHDLDQALEDVVAGLGEVKNHRDNPKSWWESRITEFIRLQELELNRAYSTLKSEQERRHSANKIFGEMLSKREPVFVPLPTPEPTAQEKFFQALMGGRVHLLDSTGIFTKLRIDVEKEN